MSGHIRAQIFRFLDRLARDGEADTVVVFKAREAIEAADLVASLLAAKEIRKDRGACYYFLNLRHGRA